MSKYISELSDQELKIEWLLWDDEISSAIHWGAALGVANEFRHECEVELKKRGLWVE